MNGFENLTGQKRGSLVIGSRASLSPLKWSVQCSKCGTSWAELHTTLTTNPSCRNSSCGRIAEPTRTLARVDAIPTGVRSADSESARKFASETRRTVKLPDPNFALMMAADSDTLARHIAHERKTHVRP